MTRDNKPISASSEGSVTRDRLTIRNGTVHAMTFDVHKHENKHAKDFTGRDLTDLQEEMYS